MSKRISRVTRDRRASWLPMIGLLCLLAPAQQAAAASSSASVFLQDASGSTTASDFQNNTSTPATATLAGATGNAVSDLAAGSVGAGIVVAPGTPTGFYDTFASWDDSWSVVGFFENPVEVVANISLDGSIDTSLLAFSDPFWQIRFEYVFDNVTVLSFSASADSTVPQFFASANGVDITSSIVFTPNPSNPLLTDFALATAPIVNVSGSSFSDRMEVSVRATAGGPFTLDAFNTFEVALTSLDPRVTFTGEGGRTIASVPEPATLALMLGGLGLLAGRRRRASA